MKVRIEGALLGARGKETMKYSVTVTGIPTFSERDRDFANLADEVPSREEAEIYAEVFQHYITNFPGAGHRLRQLANLPFEEEEEEEDVPPVEFTN